MPKVTVVIELPDWAVDEDGFLAPDVEGTIRDMADEVGTLIALMEENNA